MNLGLGLIAADNYFKEGDARKERDYVQARRDAELSTLDDKTNADRTGYRLRNDQNNANSRLLPNQTKNAESRLRLDAVNLDAEAERQTDDNAAKGLASKGSVVNAKAANINAGIGLSNAQNDQDNLPKSLQIKNAGLEIQSQTSAAALAELPEKLARAATQGVIDQQGQSDVVLGNLGQLISRQDKAGALNFANRIAKVGNILPNTNGKTFTDIIPVRKGENGATGDGYVFHTSDGGKVFTPVEAISGAMSKIKSGKYKFIERGDGSIFAGDEGTGRGALVQDGDPAMLRSRNAKNTPASVQEAEWVMANKDNPTAMAAWNKVRSLRGDGRQLFIKDLMAKSIMGNETPDQLNSKADMYGKLFDEMSRGSGQKQATSPAPSAPSPASNTPALGTLDPQIKSLLGLP